jgi:hypothetical protein
MPEETTVMTRPVGFAAKSVPAAADLAARVQRRAVLEALCGPVAAGKAMSQEIVLKTRGLIELWHERAAMLAEAGWRPLAGGRARPGWRLPAGGDPAHAARALARAAGCRPAFVEPARRGRPCGLRAACPSCYAREVVLPAWEHVDRALFRGPTAQHHAGIAAAGPARPLARSVGFDLIEWSTSEEFPFWEDVLAEGGRGLARRETLMPTMERYTAEFRGARPASDRNRGGRLCAVFVGVGTGRWTFMRRGVAMVPAGTEVAAPPDDAPRPTLAVHRHPDRVVVAEAVARMMRYEASLLVGDAACAAMILEARLHLARRGLPLYGSAGLIGLNEIGRW